MIDKKRHAHDLLPENPSEQERLKHRAEVFGQNIPLKADEEQQVTYVRFLLGSELYGIPFEFIAEIISQPSIWVPPGVPDFIGGVINWRGKIITVVDLLAYFHDQAAVRNRKHVLVLKGRSCLLGLLIDEVIGGYQYKISGLAAPLRARGIAAAEQIIGIDEELTAIINVEMLMQVLIQDTKKNIQWTGERHETRE
ncbi:MAG: hypothetical protein BGO90_01490 [Legionella sp. 40-6]|nr:chemotaxis protein CheW [Legionella sp.]OJY35797.1 MAG: hypothetical protein BGO90_01490 [Legionella sp. 40-6]